MLCYLPKKEAEAELWNEIVRFLLLDQKSILEEKSKTSAANISKMTPLKKSEDTAPKKEQSQQDQDQAPEEQNQER